MPVPQSHPQLRFQSPPRRTQHADFPHYAPLYTSREAYGPLAWTPFRPFWPYSSASIQPRALAHSQTPLGFGFRLVEDFPPQVLQTDERSCHFASASQCWLRKMCTAGALGSARVTRFHRYYGPSRHRPTFARFPDVVGYTSYLAPRDFARGVGTASPVASVVLVTVLSHFTPSTCQRASFRISLWHAAFAAT